MTSSDILPKHIEHRCGLQGPRSVSHIQDHMQKPSDSPILSIQREPIKQQLAQLERTKRTVESDVMFDGEDPTDMVCQELRLHYES